MKYHMTEEQYDKVKKGDLVTIRGDLLVGYNYGGRVATPSDVIYNGCTLEVVAKKQPGLSSRGFLLKHANGGRLINSWPPEMLKPLSSIKKPVVTEKIKELILEVEDLDSEIQLLVDARTEKLREINKATKHI